MTIPATPSTVINNLIPDLQLILQNRQDLASYNPAFYLKKAIQKITRNYPCEELKLTGPQVSLTVSIGTYPVGFWLNNGDDYRVPEAINIFTDFPNNTVAVPMKYDTIAGIRPMSLITNSLPSRWTRNGPNIIVAPLPQFPYVTFADYQRLHPFNETNLAQSVVYTPPEWHEIIEYEAAIRMAAGPLRWPDMAQNLKMLLYGDPNIQGDTGLMRDLITQQQMDEKIHVRSFTLIT
jgi:hypothetical protein